MTTVIFIDKTTSNYITVLETQRAPVPRIGERVLFDSKSGVPFWETKHYRVVDVAYSVGVGIERDCIAHVYMEQID